MINLEKFEIGQSYVTCKIKIKKMLDISPVFRIIILGFEGVPRGTIRNSINING